MIPVLLTEEFIEIIDNSVSRLEEDSELEEYFDVYQGMRTYMNYTHMFVNSKLAEANLTFMDFLQQTVFEPVEHIYGPLAQFILDNPDSFPEADMQHNCSSAVWLRLNDMMEFERPMSDWGLLTRAWVNYLLEVIPYEDLIPPHFFQMMNDPRNTITEY